jgi:hypothetical protein
MKVFRALHRWFSAHAFHRACIRDADAATTRTGVVDRGCIQAQRASDIHRVRGALCHHSLTPSRVSIRWTSGATSAYPRRRQLECLHSSSVGLASCKCNRLECYFFLVLESLRRIGPIVQPIASAPHPATMTTSDLRRRLAELDAAIVELKRDWAAVHRQLYATSTCPVLTLPIEITTKIFCCRLPSIYERRASRRRDDPWESIADRLESQRPSLGGTAVGWRRSCGEPSRLEGGLQGFTSPLGEKAMACCGGMSRRFWGSYHHKSSCSGKARVPRSRAADGVLSPVNAMQVVAYG